MTESNGMTQTNLTDDRTRAQITGLLLPLQGGQQLLIPNVTMAELAPGDTPFGEPQTDADPDWLSGTLGWRGQQIPLIRWERLQGKTPEDDSEGWRFAVLNSLYNSYSGDFYAVLIQGIPRMLRVNDGELPVINSDNNARPEVLFEVETEMGPATIPNLEWLERELGQR